MSYPDLTGRRQGGHKSNTVVELKYVTYYTCNDFSVNKPYGMRHMNSIKRMARHALISRRADKL